MNIEVELTRKQLAMDLHDSLGQELSAIKLYLNALENIKENSDAFRYTFDQVRDIVDSAMNSLHEISNNLVPSIAAQNSLCDLVRLQAEKLNRTGGIEVRFERPENELIGLQDKNKEINALRIVQEFTNNTLKHAEASRIDIKLYQDEAYVYLELEDDGIGFDFVGLKRINGVNNIATRLRYLDAKYSFWSEPGEGTHLSARIKK